MLVLETAWKWGLRIALWHASSKWELLYAFELGFSG